MKEKRWRGVRDFPNYQVSDDGVVRNTKTGRVLAIHPDRYGYPQVILCRDGYKRANRIHRLVAESFVDTNDASLQINHIDGDKTNNRFDNLEWVTASENMRHAYDNGLVHRSSKAGTPCRPVRVVETGRVYSSQSECARKIGVKREGINACLNGRLQTHHGFHYEYA